MLTKTETKPGMFVSLAIDMPPLQKGDRGIIIGFNNKDEFPITVMFKNLDHSLSMKYEELKK